MSGDKELWDVFDGCFSNESLLAMKRELFKNDEENGLMEDTRVIDRLGDSSLLSPVETALVSWMDAANEPGRFIEWWWRDEWVDFEAHRDVSEIEARKGD